MNLDRIYLQHLDLFLIDIRHEPLYLSWLVYIGIYFNLLSLVSVYLPLLGLVVFIIFYDCVQFLYCFSVIFRTVSYYFINSSSFSSFVKNLVFNYLTLYVNSMIYICYRITKYVKLLLIK